MVGDDACTTFVELLKRILDIVSQIEREKGQNRRMRAPKQPKVKVGQLSKKAFGDLQKSGMSFRYITIPADKQAEIEETVKKMGGSYFDSQLGDAKNKVIAVPESQLDLINTALKHVVAKELTQNPNAINVKDGKDLIDEKDIRLIKDTMNRYDIPVISFRTDEGKYMNVVPKEYEGQYAEAMKEAAKIRSEIDKVEIIRFEQTSPLDEPEHIAEIIPKDKADDLYAEFMEKKLDVQLVRYAEDVVMLYKSEDAERVEKAKQEYEDGLEKSEEFLIDVMDNVITLDIEKLMIDALCDEESYFMKIPNTKGQDFMRISKEDAELINGGKTVKSVLDYKNLYPIYDSSGIVRTEKSGKELAGLFNTKNRHANKNTKVYCYGTDGKELQRIDLYSAKKNEIISAKLDSADNIRIALKERGLNTKAVEKLLSDINDKLTPEQKEIFNYTATRTQTVYAEVPNIGEYLAQTQLSRNVVAKADCVGEIPKDNGAKCCLFDKKANTYAVIPVMPVEHVKAKLADMGYNEKAARELANKVAEHYKPEDNILNIDKPMQTQNLTMFGGNNAELRNMGYYSNEKSAVVIREDAEDYHYMQIDKGSSFADVEKALRDDFGIVDDMSIAAVVKQMSHEDMLLELPKKENKEAEIYQITSNIIEVTNKNTHEMAMLPINDLDVSQLTALGLSEKAARDIERSFEKNKREVGNPERQSLTELVRHAANEVGKNVGEAVKNIPFIGKGDAR